MSASGVELTHAEAAAMILGRFVRVELGRWVLVGQGLRARSALVGRVGGALRAYYNVCQHQPVELDSTENDEGPSLARRAPMSDDGLSLMCHSHGALYRPKDGLCTLGPCYGSSLIALTVDENNGKITLFPVDSA